MSASSASADNGVLWPARRHASSRKLPISNGMSARLSRSGGT